MLRARRASPTWEGRFLSEPSALRGQRPNRPAADTAASTGVGVTAARSKNFGIFLHFIFLEPAGPPAGKRMQALRSSGARAHRLHSEHQLVNRPAIGPRFGVANWSTTHSIIRYILPLLGVALGRT